MTIAGLDFEFMLAPDSEAPAEMHWFIAQFGAVTAAENCCHTLHNTYSIRGTKIRDPLAWSKYLQQTIDLWGDRVEVMYGMHHWPAWGREHVLEMLGMGRDGYRFINDETLRLANHGLTPSEIAEQVEFPPALSHHWAMRGYYGTLNHNVKATYVNYLGWFDGNPATLHTHPPAEAAKRYVEFMGGADAALEKARGAFELGDYRWVAEVVNHVVFADPGSQAARDLQADALEQLGYQAESGPWRAFYLSGALELREGVAPGRTLADAPNVDVLAALTAEMVLHVVGVRIDGPRADGRVIELDVVFTDVDEPFALTVSHGALSHPRGTRPEAPATVRAPRLAFLAVIGGVVSAADALEAGAIEIEGDAAVFDELLGLLEAPPGRFPIVTP
jgi:alkyl sulfatase BDS1-like metallo-beta-lactamase superfamily hydrolase